MRCSRAGILLLVLGMLSVPQTSWAVAEILGLDEYGSGPPVPCPNVTLNKIHNGGGTHRVYSFSGTCAIFSGYPSFNISATAVTKLGEAVEDITVSSPFGSGKVYTKTTGCNIDPFVGAFLAGTSCRGPRNISFEGDLFDNPGTPVVVPVKMGLYFAGTVKDWYDCEDWPSGMCVESSGEEPPPPPPIMTILTPEHDYAVVPAPDQSGYFYDMEIKWVGQTPPKRLHGEFERMQEFSIANPNDITTVQTVKGWQPMAGPLHHTPWENLSTVPGESGGSTHTVAVGLNTGQQNAVFTPGLYRVRVIPEDPDGAGRLRYFWVGDPVVDSDVLHHVDLPGQRKTIINPDIAREKFDAISASGQVLDPADLSAATRAHLAATFGPPRESATQTDGKSAIDPDEIEGVQFGSAVTGLGDGAVSTMPPDSASGLQAGRGTSSGSTGLQNLAGTTGSDPARPGQNIAAEGKAGAGVQRRQGDMLTNQGLAPGTTSGAGKTEIRRGLAASGQAGSQLMQPQAPAGGATKGLQSQAGQVAMTARPIRVDTRGSMIAGTRLTLEINAPGHEGKTMTVSCERGCGSVKRRQGQVQAQWVVPADWLAAPGSYVLRVAVGQQHASTSFELRPKPVGLTGHKNTPNAPGGGQQLTTPVDPSKVPPPGGGDSQPKIDPSAVKSIPKMPGN